MTAGCRDCLRSNGPQERHACLDGLSPESVFEAAVELLAHALPRPARSEGAALAFA